MDASSKLSLSGERFHVGYRLHAREAEAQAMAQHICLEQTVEFPVDLVPAGDIRDNIVGHIEDFRRINDDSYVATISFAIETTGFELPQLLNVVFGNISIMPGIRVDQLELPPALLRAFAGPRFGRTGLRERLGVATRPLLCTALKPMGLSVAELADQSYRFALGGIDIIKDDHGLANQGFAPYHERVQACVAAVERANHETGQRCLYMPNVTAPADLMLERALFAQQAGAGGLLIAPGLVGLDMMRQVADDDRINVPILSHPAWQGSLVTNPNSGISHYALFGQLARLAGADGSIYPNYGGRFAFSREDCVSICAGTAVAMAHIKPIFPAPGGGMSLARVPEMIELYGRDIIFLVGGGLHTHGPDLVQNSRYFYQLVAAL
ncbi:MAG: ribulose 1,5-bisphosphate carboxylase large subunit [Herpetosiphonaceae bacterium]|nr:ribulose 1,5-bisphosphate carboxylase large subunit [Herpetosiphonaceae bacterium]